MQTIKIGFGDFWPDFKPEDNYFTRVLSKKYKVEVTTDPDLYFFTHPYNGKRDYLRYNCHRVFLGWENKRADWTCCDYVLDSDFVSGNPRHKRWPIWAAWQPERLTLPKNPDVFLKKKKFACMVVSNPDAPERIGFFQRLSKYKKVDSGGRHLNNIGGPVANKMEFIKDYKFVFAFENSSYPGYTTEKMIEPMLVNSIPLYWGNPDVGRDFNTQSFIHVNSFDSFEKAIEQIIELDQNEEKFIEMVKQPWFPDNVLPHAMTANSLEAYFDFLLSDMQMKPPVAKSYLKSNVHRIKLFRQSLQPRMQFFRSS